MNSLVKLVIANTIVIVIATYTIIYHIEKHSVHPKHGNYVKIDLEGRQCNPWDSC